MLMFVVIDDPFDRFRLNRQAYEMPFGGGIHRISSPVEERVNLCEKTVQVERRSVDRPVTAADEALFTDKTIEATERREEAVVSKNARVVEEVGIRKDATQHTETISDKVRRTEVEVEDERGNVSRTDTSGTNTSKSV